MSEPADPEIKRLARMIEPGLRAAFAGFDARMREVEYHLKCLCEAEGITPAEWAVVLSMRSSAANSEKVT